MMLIVHEIEILIDVVEDRCRTAAQAQLWQRVGRARELLIRLLEVIQVQVAVATGPDQFPGLQIALLREQVREQGIAGDVEGHPQEEIRTALIELAGEPAAGHIELKERMAGHQAHLLELPDVPSVHDDASRIGVAAQLVYRL